MMRSVAIILSVLVLQVVPALCAAGVLAHTCGCDGAAECAPDCDCGADAACRHEAGCADDPCSALVVRPEREDLCATALAQSAMAPAVLPADETNRRALTYPRRRASAPPGGDLPYPPSARPLLL